MATDNELLSRILRGASDANIQMKNKVKYEIIIYWSEADRVYIAEAPEVPGCAADGKTYKQALENVEVIIHEWIETAKDLKRPIPEPKGRLLYA